MKKEHVDILLLGILLVSCTVCFYFGFKTRTIQQYVCVTTLQQTTQFPSLYKEVAAEKCYESTNVSNYTCMPGSTLQIAVTGIGTQMDVDQINNRS